MKPVIFAICILLFFWQEIHAIDIHVSPAGEGKELGTEAYPFHSIPAALEAAKKHTGREEVNILLNDGEYYLENTLALGHELSGTADYPLIINIVSIYTLSKTCNNVIRCLNFSVCNISH